MTLVHTVKDEDAAQPPTLNVFGMVVSEIDRFAAFMSGMETRMGLIVKSVVPDSPADRAGVSAGDLLSEADGTQVKSLNDLLKCLLLHQGSDTVGLLFRRAGSTSYLPLPLEGAHFEHCQ